MTSEIHSLSRRSTGRRTSLRLLWRAAPTALLLPALAVFLVGAALAAPAAVNSDFSQCSNKNPTLGNCVWINGIVQENNSLYGEGMSNPQRLIFDNIDSGTSHTIQFSHQFTKGGLHAYDFITSWPQAVASAAAIAGMTLTLNQCADLAAPLTTECNNIHTGAIFVDVDLPDDTYVSKDGATDSRISGYEATYGNRTMRLYSESAFVGTPTVTLAHVPAGAGSDTGDSAVFVTLTYTTTGVSETVLLEFAGHLAVSGNSGSNPVAWGPGLGAGFISGGPFHIKDVSFDGVGGSQDNQIQSPPNPTAVTLTSLGARAASNRLALAVGASGMLILAALAVVLLRRQ
jgi:hypothetical protein